jgi:hypothetical protein
VHRAEARAGQHADGGLGHHAHVDAHAVAGHDAQLGERVGHAADLGVQLAVGVAHHVARLALEDDGGGVGARPREVPVEAVVGQVGGAAHEPLGVRRLPVQHLLVRREPVEGAGLLVPERVRLVHAARVERVIGLTRADTGAGGELGRRREDARLGGDALDAGTAGVAHARHETTSVLR